MQETVMISLSEAAQRLKQSWEKTWREVLCGRLEGRKEDGRWIVEVESLDHRMRQL